MFLNRIKHVVVTLIKKKKKKNFGDCADSSVVEIKLRLVKFMTLFGMFSALLVLHLHVIAITVLLSRARYRVRAAI